MDRTLLLRIEDAADDYEHYQVSLRTWPDGDEMASGLVPKDLLPADKEDPFSVAAIRDHFANIDGEDEQFKQIGQRLFQIMAPGALAERFNPAAGSVQVVLDIASASLHTLPWELLQQDEKPIFNETSRTFLRGRPQAGLALPAFSWPLRILIVVGSEPGDEDVLAEQEVLGIICALMPIEAQVDMRILKQPTVQEIVDQFKDSPDAFHPHILHFIGHGAAEDDESFLVLHDNNEPETPKNWFANDIRGAFVAPWKPRFVFVNACRSNTNESGLWSVTEAFLDIGAAAVLGIHTDITGEHAVHFSVSFYQALAAGKSLELAVAAGRGALWNQLENASKRREWAAPCLEVRALPQEILHLDTTPAQNLWQQVRRENEFKEKLPSLVDRHQERWQVWRRLRSKNDNVIVVTGKKQIGKTDFTVQVLARCALSEMQVRYVDLINEERVDALTVLRRICEGQAKAGSRDLIKKPLPQAAFDPFREKVRELFNSDLNHELALKEPNIPDLRDMEQLMKVFCQGLETVAEAGPLAIAIDHWEKMDESQFQNFLFPYLLEWCQLRPQHDIIILLIMLPDEVTRFQADYFPIRLQDFPQKEWYTLGREFLERLFDLPDNAGGTVQRLLDLYYPVESSWPPPEFMWLKEYGMRKAKWPQS